MQKHSMINLQKLLKLLLPSKVRETSIFALFVGINQSGQSYTATAITFTISGYVRTSGGTGISGVVMGGLPSSPSTDSNGYYSSTVSYGWSGTVTPSKSGYSFSPPSTTYSSVTSNQNQNYTGTKIVIKRDL